METDGLAALMVKAAAVRQLRRRVALEKAALSARTVVNALTGGLRRFAAAEGPAQQQLGDRLTQFGVTADRWAEGASRRAFSRPSVATSPSILPLPRRLPAPLPPAVAEAYESTPIRGLPPPKPVQIGDTDIYKPSWLPWRKGTVATTASDGPHYNIMSHEIGGPIKELGRPSTLFHELGHARNPLPVNDPINAIRDRTSGGIFGKQVPEESAAWRRGSQMYRTYYDAAPPTLRATLPTPQQFLRARHDPLETYRLGELRDHHLADSSQWFRMPDTISQQRGMFRRLAEQYSGDRDGPKRQLALRLGDAVRAARAKDVMTPEWGPPDARR